MADQNNAPERIWLQDAIGPEYDRTWCAEQINDDDTLYIRADLARADRAAPEGQARAQIANLSVWSGKAHPDQQLVDLSHVLAILDTTLASREALPACQQEAWAADLAAARAEIERLTKERDAQYEENVNRIAMQAKAEAERDEALASIAVVRNEAVDWLAARLVDWWGKSNLESNEFLAEFIPAAKANIPDAQAALRATLADAERGMRQRAADVCDRNDQVSGWVSRDAILALPLKHADRDNDAAFAQGQKEGAER